MISMSSPTSCSPSCWFVVERLFWRGRALPIGIVRLRWLLPASRVGYRYPGREEPDVIERPAGTVIEFENPEWEKEAAA